jgi:hypothetical protein
LRILAVTDPKVDLDMVRAIEQRDHAIDEISSLAAIAARDKNEGVILMEARVDEIQSRDETRTFALCSLPSGRRVPRFFYNDDIHISVGDTVTIEMETSELIVDEYQNAIGRRV